MVFKPHRGPTSTTHIQKRRLGIRWCISGRLSFAGSRVRDVCLWTRDGCLWARDGCIWFTVLIPICRCQVGLTRMLVCLVNRFRFYSSLFTGCVELTARLLVCLFDLVYSPPLCTRPKEPPTVPRCTYTGTARWCSSIKQDRCAMGGFHDWFSQSIPNVAVERIIDAVQAAGCVAR
jgi:hypothetical protein